METPPPFDPFATSHPDPEATLSGPPEPWAPLPAPLLRDGPPWWMTEMIAAEPALAGRILRRMGVARRSSGTPGVPPRLEAPGRDTPAGRLAAAIRTALEKGGPVVVAGCGTSEHAAQAVAAIIGDAAARGGIRGAGRAGSVVAVPAFEAALAPQPGGLFIAVSHEGATTATLAALDAAAAAGARTAAVTASAASPVGRASIVLATGEVDRSWCHTIGYLSPLIAAVAVGAALTGEPAEAEPAAIRGLLEAGIAQAAAAEAIAAALATMREVIVVASGADRPAGRELALKIDEGGRLPARLCELETLLHGHLAAVDDGTGIVLLLADGHARAERSARAQQAMAAASRVGARAGGILAEGLDREWPAFLLPAGRILVPETAAVPISGLPPAPGLSLTPGLSSPGLPAPAAALLGTVTPLQLVTERLARARETNPDLIRRDERAYREAASLAE